MTITGSSPAPDSDQRPLVAYAWFDLSPLGKIERMVSFERPTHIPMDAISVLRGPPIPKESLPSSDTP